MKEKKHVSPITDSKTLDQQKMNDTRGKGKPILWNEPPENSNTCIHNLELCPICHGL
ncbi:MAG: hypothetical protein GY765_19135 [bacterium]|nr:hypothetical protein [bacterium]